jgi:hypothetical protein
MLRVVFVPSSGSYDFIPSDGYDFMYDIKYELFPCFLAALVSYKSRENFRLILFFPHGFSAQPDCIDYFNIVS